MISWGERLHHRRPRAEEGEVVAVATFHGHGVHQPLAWDSNREHGVAVGAAHVAQVLGRRHEIHCGGDDGGDGDKQASPSTEAEEEEEEEQV